VIAVRTCEPGQLRAVKLRYKTKAESQTCKAHMAHNTASPIHRKPAQYISRGKSPSTPVRCVGCGGKKKRQHLYCKSCRLNYLAARKAEQELDEMFEAAIR